MERTVANGNVHLQNSHVVVPAPEPQNVAEFGDSVSEGVMKAKWCHQNGPRCNMTDVLIRKGDQERDRQEDRHLQAREVPQKNQPCGLPEVQPPEL